MAAILEAINNRDLEKLKSLNLTGKEVDKELIDPDKPQKKGKTPLTLACEKGYLDVIKVLVEQMNANVNRKDGRSYTPLYQACLTGDREIIEFLVQNKADVNKTGINSFTPLFAAVEKDNLELMKYLVSVKADLSVTCSRGGLIRHAACKNKSPKCFDYFLKNNLDLNTYQKQFGHTIVFELCTLYMAIGKSEKDRKVVLEYLEKLLDAGADHTLFCKQDGIDMTPLHLACKHVNFVLIKTLLEHKGDVNQKDEDGATPLLTMFFLERNKDPSAPKVRKKMPIECIQLLFKHKADPNIPNDAGVTPFLYLISSFICGMKEDENILKLFLKYGADVTVTDFNGDTPLHHAASKDSIGLCKILLEYRAEVNAVNGGGETPLYYSARHENSFKFKGALWDFFLENGAEVNTNSDGDFPHFVASASNRLGVFNSMIKHGVDINAQNKQGETYIHMLAKNHTNHMLGFREIQNTIEYNETEQKFDLLIQDKHGKDFFDTIFSKKYDGNIRELNEVLDKNGYEVAQLDFYGQRIGKNNKQKPGANDDIAGYRTNTSGHSDAGLFYFRAAADSSEESVGFVGSRSRADPGENFSRRAGASRSGAAVNSTGESKGPLSTEPSGSMNVPVSKPSSRPVELPSLASKGRPSTKQTIPTEKKVTTERTVVPKEQTVTRERTVPREQTVTKERTVPKERTVLAKKKTSTEKQTSVNKQVQKENPISKEKQSSTGKPAPTKTQTPAKKQAATNKTAPREKPPPTSKVALKDNKTTPTKKPVSNKKPSSTDKPTSTNKQTPTKDKASGKQTSTKKPSEKQAPTNSKAPKDDQSSKENPASKENNEPSPKEQQPAEEEDDVEEDEHKDVMISYNWDHQDIALKIRDFLVKNGQLSVWIDLEQMSDDMYTKMAQAVFNSKIIVMCLSSKYEKSANCRLEYEYTKKKNKTFVPVKVQQDFQPKDANSLDLILGNKMYYLMEQPEDFDNNMPKVLDLINKHLGKK